MRDQPSCTHSIGCQFRTGPYARRLRELALVRLRCSVYHLTVAVEPKGQLVAMGGGGFSMEPDDPLLDDYVLGLTSKRRLLGSTTG